MGAFASDSYFVSFYEIFSTTNYTSYRRIRFRVGLIYRLDLLDIGSVKELRR